MTTVKSLSAAAEAGGANGGAAAITFASMATVVKTKSDAGQTMDLKRKLTLIQWKSGSHRHDHWSTALSGINVANFTTLQIV